MMKSNRKPMSKKVLEELMPRIEAIIGRLRFTWTIDPAQVRVAEGGFAIDLPAWNPATYEGGYLVSLRGRLDSTRAGIACDELQEEGRNMVRGALQATGLGYVKTSVHRPKGVEA